MNSSDRPSSRAQLGEQIEHGGLDRDVERRGHLVADQQRPAARPARVRSRRAGARRRRARRDSGRRAAPAAAPARAAAPPRLAPPAAPRPRSDARGPSDRVARPVCRGLSESYGFWNTIWIAAALLARARARAGRPAAAPSSRMRPGRRRVQARRCSARSWSCRCPTRRRARRTRPPRRRTTRRRRPRRRPARVRCAARRRLDARAAAPPSPRRGAAASRGSSRGAASRCHSQAAHVVAGADRLERRHRRARTAGTRSAQRGANAQPGGRSPTPTATPRIAASRRGSTWSGTERAGRACTGGAGGASTCAAGPASTMRPAYITAIAVGDRRHDGEVVARRRPWRRRSRRAAARSRRGCAPG